MANNNNYHYIIFKGYIHKIPIIDNDEERDNSNNKKDQIKKKKKEKES